MRYGYISIEGNIGAGKSTLANLLAKHFDAQLILEEFADNNFLGKFYQEPERYAFPLELSFLADRFNQLRNLSQQTIIGQTVVADYTFQKCNLFAGINLKEEEYELFKKLFQIMEPQLQQPEVLIFLYCPVQLLQEHIQKRGRFYEQNIRSEYLQKVEEKYKEYLKQTVNRTVLVDGTFFDFVHEPHHFQHLCQFLEQDIPSGINFLPGI